MPEPAATAAPAGAAAHLLGRVLAALPATEHGPLVPAPGTEALPAELLLDRDWLTEQVRLRGRLWQADDDRVRTTLWWYSTSAWLPHPALASLVVTGQALSPRLADMTVHWAPDGRITGFTSRAVLTGNDPVTALGAALRETLTEVIPLLAEVGGMRQRPLWALAADSVGDRLVWIGRALGDVPAATALALPVARAIGAPFPAPHYVDVPPAHTPLDSGAATTTPARFLRRCSCCLVYETPSLGKCDACPKRSRHDREHLLQAAATRLAAD
ncbi:(2Fe-2S)-binding protein [Nakamurella leprariae]|uniref:(2Fe-2S)-binding protein n=1 Tax=Nakamurella leprariae TaxID=2803911 RepID=A0A939BXF4_9ACTN|nr:(2Fe-2S)-binding protein [Nakamurella leprariae]MBM9468503.1 (2Fe-2S)-binding protein [Nakamurella leprariae]